MLAPAVPRLGREPARDHGFSPPPTTGVPTAGVTSRSIALAASPLLALLWTLPGAAAGIDGDDFVVYIGLASDYAFRGYSQTQEDPAVKLGLDFEHESGLFAGLSASNVDFPPAGPFEDTRDLAVRLYAGYGLELGREWGLSGTVVRYEYPGSEGVIDWNYTEVGLALHYGAAALAVAYSDSALGSGDPGLVVELTDRWPLPADLRLAAGLGFYDVDSPFLEDYVYWNIGLSKRLRRFTLTLDYVDTDGRGEEIWGELAGARLIAGITFRIH